MKFTCSSRSSRASQSPHTVEKQPKSTPDTPTHSHAQHGAWEWIINISTRTFIVAVRTVCEFCEDSDESQTTSINAFIMSANKSAPKSRTYRLQVLVREHTPSTQYSQRPTHRQRRKVNNYITTIQCINLGRKGTTFFESRTCLGQKFVVTTDFYCMCQELDNGPLR